MHVLEFLLLSLCTTHSILLGYLLPNVAYAIHLFADGDSNSAIGIVPLRFLSDISNIDVILLQPMPSADTKFNWWQYGQGTHASNHRQIIGSVDICVLSDSGRPIRICHLVVDGSSHLP